MAQQLVVAELARAGLRRSLGVAFGDGLAELRWGVRALLDAQPLPS